VKKTPSVAISIPWANNIAHAEMDEYKSSLRLSNKDISCQSNLIQVTTSGYQTNLISRTNITPVKSFHLISFRCMQSTMNYFYQFIKIEIQYLQKFLTDIAIIVCNIYAHDFHVAGNTYM